MTRKYEQRLRAEKQEATRRRIVEAAVELHRTEGPAQTTMSAVADRAGVQRNTLYRHFPDEKQLLLACSAHFVAEHPMPDVDGWEEIGDPVERCRHGLAALYAYWEENEEMSAHVLRDSETHAGVREVNELRVAPSYGRIREALLAGWPPARQTAELAAAVDLAMGFRTWQSLVRGSGLDSAAAAALMGGLVGCAAVPRG